MAGGLHAHGLGVELPPGWEARIYRREAAPGLATASADPVGATTHSVLHAANFPLPEQRADFGGGAVEAMGPGHALVVLVEYDPASAKTALFARRGLPRLRPEQFSPATLQRALPGQAGSQSFFSVNRRAFCLYVVLGSYDRRKTLVPMVNSVLEAVVIDRQPT